MERGTSLSIYSKGNNMLNWINNNNGFIISILTFIYVVTTICIFLSNRKSAKAASEQIQEMRQQRNDVIASAKQQTALQLLERRIKALNILKEWMNSAKSLNGNPPFGTAKELFLATVFKNHKDREMIEINEKINYIKNILSSGLPNTSKQQELNKTLQQLHNNALMTKIELLHNDSLILDQIDALFSSVKFEDIKIFMDTYFKTVMDINQSDELKTITNKLLHDNIEEKLWSELKENVIINNP
jgi:hypothetical protein